MREREREKGKEVGSTSIPFSHSPLIGYFTLLISIEQYGTGVVLVLVFGFYNPSSVFITK